MTTVQGLFILEITSFLISVPKINEECLIHNDVWKQSLKSRRAHTHSWGCSALYHSMRPWIAFSSSEDLPLTHFRNTVKRESYNSWLYSGLFKFQHLAAVMHFHALCNLPEKYFYRNGYIETIHRLSHRKCSHINNVFLSIQLLDAILYMLILCLQAAFMYCLSKEVAYYIVVLYWILYDSFPCFVYVVFVCGRHSNMSQSE